MGRKQDRKVSAPFHDLTTEYTDRFDHPRTYIEEDHPTDNESTVVSVGEHREFNDLLIAEETTLEEVLVLEPKDDDEPHWEEPDDISNLSTYVILGGRFRAPRGALI